MGYSKEYQQPIQKQILQFVKYHLRVLGQNKTKEGNKIEKVMKRKCSYSSVEKKGKIQTLFGSGEELFGTVHEERSLALEDYLKQKEKENKKPNLVKEVRLVNACIEQG